MSRPLATEKLANRSDTIYIVYYAHDTQSWNLYKKLARDNLHVWHALLHKFFL